MKSRVKKYVAVAAAVLASSMVFAGCGSSSSSSESKTIKVFYQKTDTFKSFDLIAKPTKAAFEKAHPNVKVELQPVSAQESDYKTKLALAERSPETAPDVIYQDSDSIQADADAGYLANLNKYVNKWADWRQYLPTAKQIGQGKNGYYGVPLNTDTRVIWYNKTIFAKAGISMPWQPKTWDDVTAAAQKIHDNVPGVIPLNMYAGTPRGEGTSMQSFYELLFGTKQKNDALRVQKTGKWVIGSQGFKDSLKFLKNLYDKKYAPAPSEELDSNITNKVSTQWMPQGKLGMMVDGSWMPQNWVKGGPAEWPDYTKTLDVAFFPTQNGQGPHYVSASGGWNVSIGAKSKNQDLAFEYIKMLNTKENNVKFLLSCANTAVRKDVAADPRYKAITPFTPKLTEAVKYTHFRPSVTEYTKVSAEIQKATEKVITGTSVDEAAQGYDQAVQDIVGQGNYVKKD
ncbi:extracellular solute-binding protein [Bifidobacterium sp. ESL0775]|uniref:extracellular solute-binding protein n=1 Tax=Bifidobacterium sp. ESL0775 TaxID=2983230 RepID=UPI0023F63B68|nr:extracellular solute-binding protein [Bifidobacterium sp. ESL0775]WEV69804.1 extracellular solute-binding protein [Bifidobacterium sp. ESL0775]